MLNYGIYERGRYWEVDLLRGIGITMMIISNAVTDFQFFLGYSEHPLFWRIFAITTASIFIFTSGLSFWISYSRTIRKNPKPYGKYLKRALKLIGLGLLITLITMSFDAGTIYFGILTFLGVSTLLGIPFCRLRKKNLLAGPLIFIAWLLFIRNLHGPIWLLPIGVLPRFFMLDYFPIFPWFSLYLIGMGIGSIFYPGGKRRRVLKPPHFPVIPVICFAGRHSLPIYLIHQPIIVGILLLIYGHLPGLPI
ncbi:heparan-alpha-glucosaminide N-acetyltransferase [Thermococcus sp.]